LSVLPVPVRFEKLGFDLLLDLLDIFFGRKEKVQKIVKPCIGVFEIAHVCDF